VQLQGDPKRIGIGRHIVVKDATTIMANDEKAIQNAEGERRHREKIHRRNLCSAKTSSGYASELKHLSSAK
jgi:hypothetical protein